MRRAWVAFVLTMSGVTAGCDTSNVTVEGGGGQGGEGGSPDAFESTVPPFNAGSRLTPRILDGGDGAQVLFDFFDHQLGTSCAFLPTVAGDFRCLPQARAGCAELGNLNQCGTPAFATVFQLDECSRVLANGAVQAPAGSTAAQPLQDLRSRDCGGGPPLDAWSAVPLESFVGATTELVVVEGNLAVERLVADDGTTVTIGFARDGNRCEPARFGADLRCLDVNMGAPRTWTSAPEVPLYVGTSCQGDRAGFYSPACGQPKPGLASTTTWSDPPICPADGQYFELLETVGDCSADVNGDCIPMIAAEYADQGIFVRMGAEIPASALPSMVTADIGGTGRLRVRTAVAGGAALGSTQMRFASNDITFFDTAFDILCTAQIVGDDEVRCVPGGRGFETAYQDAQCTVPLMAPDEDHCGVVTDNRFLPRFEDRECGGGLQPSEVWERGEPYEGVVYWKDFAHGGCSPMNNDGWFKVGTVHPITDFAVVSLTDL